MNTVILQLDFRLQGGKSSDSAGGVHVFSFFFSQEKTPAFSMCSIVKQDDTSHSSAETIRPEG